MMLTIRTRRSLALALAVLAPLACKQVYPELAGRFATDEIAAAGEFDRIGGLPYRLCERQATYRFVFDVQNQTVPPPPWPVWYEVPDGSPSARPTLLDGTWKQECDETYGVTQVMHTVYRGMRAHGQALAALAGGPPFDASGLEQAGGLAAAAAEKVGASGAAGVARAAGTTFAAGTKLFVEAYRAHELERAVAGEHECMTSTFGTMSKLAETMKQRVADIEHLRVGVVDMLVNRYVDAGRKVLPGDRALALVEALEVGGESERELKEADAVIAAYERTLANLEAAHQLLSTYASSGPHANADDVKSALGQLESSIDDLIELER